MKNFKKGFTLIELLVVVAIIGVLAAVVLGALNSAKSKGNTAAVKSQMKSLRNQGEIYYTNQNGTYSGVCVATIANNGFGAGSGSGLFVNTAKLSPFPTRMQTNTAGNGEMTTCNDAASGWMVETPLTGSVAASPKMFCADSTGTYKTNTVSAGSSTVCP